MEKIEQTILNRIKDRELTVSELAKRLNKDISQVSRELKYMRTGRSLLSSNLNKYIEVLGE